MQYEKFKEYEGLFYFGIANLVLSLGLIIFALYILPFLFWDTNYGVPYFVSDLISYYHDTYEYSYAGSKTIVEMWFLIPGLVTGIIAYFVSNYIDKQVYIEKPVQEEVDPNRGKVIKKELKESANLGLRIFVLMILVIAGFVLLQSIFFGK
ncbi:MAG: hypothetical protein WC627_06445 [Legionella sp.]|jgi:hypothetical protein